MPRPKRKCAGGVVYHVLNHANGRLRIFKKRADFEAFERILAEGLDRVPMRAGLVDDSRNWQYSSLAIRNGIEKQSLAIDRGPVVLPDNWNKHVKILPRESIDAKIQNCIKRGSPFGNDKWISLASQKLGLEMTLRPRGRPRKGTGHLV